MGEFNLDLDTLSKDIPVISDSMQGFYRDKTLACLQRSGHQSGVIFSVDKQGTMTSGSITWSGSLSKVDLATVHVDSEEMTEYGACSLALLMIRELTDLKTCRQSARGTGIDYYLAKNDDESTLIFNDAARLEVSGILQENRSNSVDSRIRTKINRLNKNALPTIIIVVEFSRPWSKMVKHE